MDPRARRKLQKLQISIAHCQKLFFLDDTSPVFLHTDASSYGIGAYLFQEVDGKRYPIAFISRTLNKTELRWSTMEKEAYSIFYAFQKLEHLIRDRHFTLRTDSKNLTFLNVDHREKVKRWKLAIQHFDFDVFHIKGTDNIEADGFSRLVHFPTTSKTEEAPKSDMLLNNMESTSSLRPEIYAQIKAVHGGKAGHGGVQRTLDKLKALYPEWTGKRGDVKQFISNCPCCQKMSALKPLIHTNPFTLASYNPMDRICIDTIGPINEEGQDSAYKHILVIIDAFSRFVRLYPVVDTSAESALGPLKDWVCTFGCPSEIVSDNGSQFVNELIKAFLDNSGIQHSLIHAYSKEENGLVERSNKEVNRHITSMAYDSLIRASWRDYLPYVQRIMNTQVHNSIGVSPSQLIFGNAINHDAHFLMEPGKDSSLQTYHERIAKLYKAQAKLLEIAQKNQLALDSFHMAKRAVDEVTTFPINSYVLAEYETRKPSKYQTNLHGPYRVISAKGSIYTLENLITHALTDFHVKLLREFRYDAKYDDPIEVARHDKEYDEIRQILSHRFTSKRQTRSNLEFQLIWSKNPEPVWQAWNATLGANETVHAYLRDNRMRRMIPAKYTWPKDDPRYEPPERRIRPPEALPEDPPTRPEPPAKRRRRRRNG